MKTTTTTKQNQKSRKKSKNQKQKTKNKTLQDTGLKEKHFARYLSNAQSMKN